MNLHTTQGLVLAFMLGARVMFMGPNDTMFNGILINMYTNVMPCNYC